MVARLTHPLGREWVGIGGAKANVPVPKGLEGTFTLALY
jgi:hypothetical protein